MKKLLPLILLASATAANAGEIRSTIVDSVQLTVDAPAVTSTRTGSQYSVSGTNISAANGSNGASSLGQLAAPTATAPALITDGTYSVDTDGAAFTFSESALVGDVAVTSQSSLSSGGRVDTPNIYGQTTQYQGGTPGTLAGTVSATGVPTVTAGGSGTSAIGQRTVELTVFR